MLIEIPFYRQEAVSPEAGGDVGGDAGGPSVVGGGYDNEAERPDVGESDSVEPTLWLKDLTEDDAYGILSKARHFDEKLETSLSPIQQQFAEFQRFMEGSNVPHEPQIDVDKINSILEEYDPGLAKTGLAQALAESIKFNPISQETIAPMLKESIGDLPVGNQIVLSHYDIDDVKAIVPPSDQNGSPVPETQRHKDFLSWFEIQSPSTQQSLQVFGPGYVRALKKFESWEQEQKQNRTQAVEDKSSRLAGGVQPSANRRSGGSSAMSSRDLFLAGFNEEV